MAAEVMDKFWGGVHRYSFLMLQFHFLYYGFASVLAKEFHQNTKNK
jgi:hypothetical protein